MFVIEVLMIAAMMIIVTNDNDMDREGERATVRESNSKIIM